MTEQEAAEKLAAVMNELKDAGYDPFIERDGSWVYVGETHRVAQAGYTVDEGWGKWEVRRD